MNRSRPISAKLRIMTLRQFIIKFVLRLSQGNVGVNHKLRHKLHHGKWLIGHWGRLIADYCSKRVTNVTQNANFKVTCFVNITCKDFYSQYLRGIDSEFLCWKQFKRIFINFWKHSKYSIIQKVHIYYWNSKFLNEKFIAGVLINKKARLYVYFNTIE